jgi:hypothetical protein
MHHTSTTRRARTRRFALGSGLALGAVLGAAAGPASPAAAGGVDFMHSVQERYEPGETATMIGDTSAGASTGMPSGDIGDGPYFGRLVADPESGRHIDLGPTTVTETGRRDRFAVRLSITFTVPAGLAPSAYEVLVCDASCSRSLGELYGGTIHVGVDPPPGLDRGWLIDDPAVAELPDGARVSGVPVERIRAGEAVVPWYDAPPEPLPAPSPAPEPRPGAVTPDTAGGEPAADARTVTVADGEDTGGGPGPGLADVAPWAVPLVLVAAVWRLVRRGRGTAVVTSAGPAAARAVAAPGAGTEPAPALDPSPTPDPEPAAPAREPIRL